MPRRKKVLEQVKLKNKIADICFRQGEEKCYNLFVTAVNGLYEKLMFGDYITDFDGEALEVMAYYISELRRKAPFSDILGDASIELTPFKPSQEQASFFLPENIATMMSNSKIMESNHLSSIQDRHCGSGTLLLSLASAIYKKGGVELLKKWNFEGFDRNVLNAKMCSVQFLANLANINAAPGVLKVIHKPVDNKKYIKELLHLVYDKITGEYSLKHSNNQEKQHSMFGK